VEVTKRVRRVQKKSEIPKGVCREKRGGGEWKAHGFQRTFQGWNTQMIRAKEEVGLTYSAKTKGDKKEGGR